MVTRTPLKFEFDVKTPSSIAEFTASDVVGVENGGTGVSSLALLGIALSSIDVSSASVSATTISSPTFTGGTFTGASVSATDVSATTISSPAFTGDTFTGGTFTGASVSATDVSAVSLVVEKAGATGMPIPAPYGFVHFTSDGTASDTEQNVGIGCTTSTNISDSSDFTWDDVNKRFDVLKTGTYEITLSIILTVASTTNVTLQLYSTSPGSSQLSADARVHSSIDPSIYTVSWIGTFAGGAYAYATTVDDGATDVTVNSGSTLTVKRLK